MCNIILISNYNNTTSEILNTVDNNGFSHFFCNVQSSDPTTIVEKKQPDVIIIDSSIDNAHMITKQIKTQTQANNTRVILLLDKELDVDFLNFADGYIIKPIAKNILVQTINSHIKTKKSLDLLNENNKELAKSLYQQKVLYNTSSDFAGTLNKEKLYKIMLEALEKTLSYDISCALVFTTQGEANFHINSLQTMTDDLKEGLKLKSTMGYKNIFNNKNLPYQTSIEEMNIFEHVKPSHKQGLYDLSALEFDSLFAPIKLDDNFYGVVEVFRQSPFTKEDIACFQTIVQQVTLPLRSATLYEDIKIANIKLEKLERLKSDFVSIVSHELRTPLTPINNSLEIVLSGQTGEISSDAKNFINMAKRNVSRLSTIIEDLLDLSRVQMGKLDYKYKQSSIVPSLELIEKTFEQIAAEKNIKLKLDIQDELIPVYADTQRVEQILSNLVNNAIKFTQNGGSVKVQAKTINAKDINQNELINPIEKLEGEYIQISTADNGIGLKQENIEKIFERFSQIENSLTRNKGGVGLGLPITKQLLDAHLGAISVTSTEGKGSVFTFYIPKFDEKKKFLLDINHALTLSEEAFILKVEQNEGCDFIDHIIKSNLIKLTRKSREFYKDDCYMALLMDMTPNAFEFIQKTIQNEAKKPEFEKCDILLKGVVPSQDGNELSQILKKINNKKSPDRK